MRALTGLLLSLLCAGPAIACQVGGATTGTFPMQPSGNIYGSDLGGIASALTITDALQPAYHVSVTAPSLTGSGLGFNTSGATVQIAYTAIGTGISYTQDFTSAASGFDAPAIATAVLLTFQSRIVTTTGFTAGTYGTRVTVTCQ